MATRTIVQCDRCKKEVNGPVHSLTLDDGKADICQPCCTALEKEITFERERKRGRRKALPVASSVALTA